MEDSQGEAGAEKKSSGPGMRHRSSFLTVIIINYNGQKFLSELFDGLDSQGLVDFCILFVDSGSTDNSTEWVRKRSPEARVMELGDNVGFARAANLGVSESSSRYIVLLNPDLRLEPSWLEELAKPAESRQDIAAVASKMLLYDRPHLLNGVGGCMNRLGYTWDRGMFEEDQGQYDTPCETFFASGAAALFRRRVFLHSGGFDERFFMYHEDVDLCWRLWLLGHQVITSPRAVVYHHFGGTTRATKGLVWREILGERNNIRSIIKNYELRNVLRTLKDHLLIRSPARRKFAQCKNFWWNLCYLGDTLSERRRIQSSRIRSDSDLASLIVQSKNVPVRI